MENVNKTNGTEEKETASISYEDLLMVASGTFDTGEPASIGTVVIDKLNSAGEQVPDMEILLQKSMFSFFASGGCLVVQVDFPPTGAFEYSKAIDILATYHANASDEEYVNTHVLGVIVVPMLFQGQITISLRDLVYFTGFDLPNLEKRLIMCFNDLETEVMDTSGMVDYEKLESQIKAEIQREQDKLQEEIDAVNEELENEKKINPYSEALLEKYNQSPELNLEKHGEGADDSNKWFRKSKD